MSIKKNSRIYFFIFLILVWPLLVSANSGLVTFESALVWRADTKGDYQIGKIPSPGIYEVSSAYKTQGTVETITVNYWFEGKVALEVSTDNGDHYMSVTNGVPLDLSSGFNSDYRGNQIKWRATLGEDSKLREVKILYTDTSGVIATFGQPQLSGFKFRKLLHIANPLKKDLFNYQIPISVGQSANASFPGIEVTCGRKIKADFGDIRFTSADGETILPYYLESVIGKSPNKTAIFWVKIPQIPSEGLPIYIYYGNRQAQSKSSGKDVFDFFDDFSQGELDKEVWQADANLKDNHQLINSQLHLKGTAIRTKKYRFKDGIIEYQTKAEALIKDEDLVEQADFEARLIIRTNGENLKQVAYSSAYPGAEHCLAVNNIVKKNRNKPILSGVIYRYKVKAYGDNFIFTRYSTLNTTYSILNTQYSIPEAEVSYTDEGGLKQGYIGLRVEKGNVAYYDWLRVRKYAAVEPTISSSEEEITSLPYFSGSTLASNGNLVLAQGNTVGSYVSKGVPLSFQARIFIPVWTEDKGQIPGISLDVSANGGKRYKKNCKNRTHYYASKGDFTAGDSLKFSVKLAESRQLKNISLAYHFGNIKVVSPRKDERWKVGKLQKILWLTSGYDPTYPLRIEYSLNQGKTYRAISKKNKNINAYFWKIPPKLAEKKIIIKISDSLYRAIYGISGETNQITP